MNLEVQVQINSSRGLIGGILSEKLTQSQAAEDQKQEELALGLQESYHKRKWEGMIDARESLRIDYTHIEPISPFYMVKWPLRQVIRARIAQAGEQRKYRQELYLRRFADDYQSCVSQGFCDLLTINNPALIVHDGLLAKFTSHLASVTASVQDRMEELPDVFNPTESVVGGTLGQQILIYRKNLGLSRAHLAKLVNIDPSHLYRLEINDRHPSSVTVLLLARALGLSTEQTINFIQSAGYSEHLLKMTEMITVKRRAQRNTKNGRTLK